MSVLTDEAHQPGAFGNPYLIEAMKAGVRGICALCAGPATIIDHHMMILVGNVKHPDEDIAEISMECPTCPNHIRQEVRVTKVTEEEILAHSRHYTQLPNKGRR